MPHARQQRQPVRELERYPNFQLRLSLQARRRRQPDRPECLHQSAAVDCQRESLQ